MYAHHTLACSRGGRGSRGSRGSLSGRGCKGCRGSNGCIGSSGSKAVGGIGGVGIRDISGRRSRVPAFSVTPSVHKFVVGIDTHARASTYTHTYLYFHP